MIEGFPTDCPKRPVTVEKEEDGDLNHRRDTRGPLLLAQLLLRSELGGIMADKTILVLVRPK